MILHPDQVTFTFIFNSSRQEWLQQTSGERPPQKVRLWSEVRGGQKKAQKRHNLKADYSTTLRLCSSHLDNAQETFCVLQLIYFFT